MGMLKQECEKFDVPLALRDVATCDTLALSRRLRPDLESHALASLIDALGVEGANSHAALDDALACAAVFFRLLT